MLIKEEMDKIGSYLATKPWQEVHHLIMMLNQAFQRNMEQPKPEVIAEPKVEDKKE